MFVMDTTYYFFYCMYSLKPNSFPTILKHIIVICIIAFSASILPADFEYFQSLSICLPATWMNISQVILIYTDKKHNSNICLNLLFILPHLLPACFSHSTCSTNFVWFSWLSLRLLFFKKTYGFQDLRGMIAAKSCRLFMFWKVGALCY